MLLSELSFTLFAVMTAGAEKFDAKHPPPSSPSLKDRAKAYLFEKMPENLVCIVLDSRLTFSVMNSEVKDHVPERIRKASQRDQIESSPTAQICCSSRDRRRAGNCAASQR